VHACCCSTAQLTIHALLTGDECSPNMSTMPHSHSHCSLTLVWLVHATAHLALPTTLCVALRNNSWQVPLQVAFWSLLGLHRCRLRQHI